MTPTREEVIRVARECGITFAPMVVDGVEYQFRHVRFHDPNCDSDEADCIERLAAHFYEAGAAEAREPLVEALQPFVLANSSEEYITLVVRTDDVTKARAAIAKATGEKT